MPAGWAPILAVLRGLLVENLFLWPELGRRTQNQPPAVKGLYQCMTNIRQEDRRTQTLVSKPIRADWFIKIRTPFLAMFPSNRRSGGPASRAMAQ